MVRNHIGQWREQGPLGQVHLACWAQKVEQRYRRLVDRGMTTSDNFRSRWSTEVREQRGI